MCLILDICRHSNKQVYKTLVFEALSAPLPLEEDSFIQSRYSNTIISQTNVIKLS